MSDGGGLSGISNLHIDFGYGRFERLRVLRHMERRTGIGDVSSISKLRINQIYTFQRTKWAILRPARTTEASDLNGITKLDINSGYVSTSLSRQKIDYTLSQYRKVTPISKPRLRAVPVLIDPLKSHPRHASD
jgi:hypothetical protein